MKKAKFLVAVVLPVLAGMLITTEDVHAACKAEKVKVQITPHGINMTPDDGPKCLFVNDLANVDVSFPIDLKTPGSYELRDGQVHVRRVAIKEAHGASIGCSSNLEFEQSVYTNVGEDDIVVRVLGEDIAEDEFICYEIVVDDIGMLDPRAEVEDQDALLGHIGGELAELIDAYNLLVGSGLGSSLTSVSLGDFIESNYGMTEAEAYQLIDDYRE